MRTISQAVIDAQTNDRYVEARVTISDPRLRFSDQRATQVDYIVGDTVLAYDDCAYSGGILRVAAVQNGAGYELWANYITDIDGVWPSWVNTGVLLRPGSRPGVYGGRVIYLDATHRLCSRDWDGSNFPVLSEVLLDTLPAGSTADISLISTQVYYMHYHNEESDSHGFILRKDIATPANDRTWDGATVNAPAWGAFDAVSFDGGEYIYYSDRGYRAKGMRVMDSGDFWGRPFEVVPLDIVDDTSLFKLGHASVINGIVFLTGILKRPSAPGMHVYFRGPEKFTMGRDMFIARADIDVFQWEYDDASTIGVTPLGGQLHEVDNEIWYLAPVTAYMSPATPLTGYNNPARTFTTNAITNIRLDNRQGASNRLTFELPDSVSHAALREGSEVTLEVATSGNWATVGVFAIDAIGTTRSAAGKARAVACRSRAIKNLSQWQPDADFDYWGQTKQAENPHELSTVVRSDGLWEQRVVAGQNVIFLEQLNTTGILYATGMPADGTVGRGLFYYPGDDQFTPEYGVIVQYAYEQYEAAEGAPDGADTYEMGHNGVAVIYSPTEHSGAPGFSVNYWKDGVNEKLTSFAFPIPADTWHWIQVSFEDSRVLVHYRLDTSTDWSLVGDCLVITGLEDAAYPGITLYAADTNVPENDTRARAALYIHNRTPYTTAYGVHTKADVVGVDDASVIPMGETVVIDQEQMLVIGRNYAPANAPDGLAWAEGYTFEEAPHHSGDPLGYDGYEIYFQGYGNPLWGEHYFDDLALVITSGPGEGRCYRITGYDYHAPDQWAPSGTYSDPDKWTDHVGDPAYGMWVDSFMQRVFVSERPADAFGEGAVCAIVDSLEVSRGQNGTQATSHSNGAFCSVYRDLSVVSTDYHFLTTGIDKSFAEVAEEIARKAGLLRVSVPNRVPTNQARAAPGWALDIASTEQSLRNCVVSFDLASNGTAGGFGVAYGLSKDGLGGYSGGRIVMVYQDRVEFLDYDPAAPALRERMTYRMVDASPDYKHGQAKISIFNEFVSVWIAGRWVHTFVDRTAPEIESGALEPEPIYAGIVLHNEVEVDVTWPEVCRYVDNFVMTMGTRGYQLMQQLVGERRIYFQDDQGGDLKVYKDRVTVNAGSPYELLMSSDEQSAETDLVTRVRVEGGTVAEQFNEAMMREHGNLFALVNSTELDDYFAIYHEALDSLEDFESYGRPVTLVGMPDLRVEAGDKILIDDQDAQKTVIVDRVGLILSVDETLARYDMTVEGRIV